MPAPADAPDAPRAPHTRHSSSESDNPRSLAADTSTGEPAERGQQLRRSQALAAVAREVAGLDEPAQWANRAVAAVASATGWSRVFLFRRDNATGALRLLGSRGATAQQVRESATLNPDGPSVSALAVRRGEPVVVGQTEVPPNVAVNARRHGLVSYVALPLVARGRALGSLTLIDSAPRGVAEDELEFLQAIAHGIAAGLENARLYAEAEAARLWLRTIFNQMADGVLVLDPQGRVVERNATVNQMFGGEIPLGATPEERRKLFDLRRADGTPMPPEEHPSAVALTTGQPVTNVQMQVVHRDGAQRELSASASPLHDESGRLLGAVTVLRDVTELRRLERAKDSFLSVASHELRTPLTPLKGLTQILLRQLERAGASGAVDRDRIERYLRTMDGQVDRLAGLVNDLLDVSRIRTGRMQLRPESVDLVMLTRGVLERFAAIAPVEIVAPGADGSPRTTDRGRPSAAPAQRSEGGLEMPGSGVVERVAAAVIEPADEREARQIRLEVRVPSLGSTWDPARLEQVITNLVANSIKYSPAGGTITVVLERREAPDGAMAHLAVHDPGIGLPPEQIVDLFQPFARLANAPAESFGGLGLGLYISHDIVQRHGGQIWAESPGAGKGSTFHVALPLE